MAQGATWMVGMRWVIRSIGLVNTIILARLLTPQDFGLVAMATVVIGLLDSVADVNVDLPLIRNRAIVRDHYDSAWTLQVLSGWAKSGLYIGVAPFLATYYGDPRVATITYIIALRPAIEGFENIGQVDFRRDLCFDTDFRYWVFRRLLTFLLTIGIALWLRNYLALAIAAPISGAVTVFLSYVMSAYRPRFATRHIGEIWTFSKWWMLLGVMQFFGRRGEAFILGRLTTPQVIGVYTMGGDFSAHLIQDTVGSIGRALIPSYATALQNPAQLSRAFQLSFALLATFSLATGVGESLVAKDLVLVFLGAHWTAAIPFVRWLAIHAASWSIVASMQPYFLVTKREALFSLCNMAYVAVLIPAIVIAAHAGDVETVALTRSIVTTIFLVGMLGVLVVLRIFNLWELLKVFWRPAIATVAMAICVSSINVSGSPIVSLGLRVAMGLAIFPTVLAILWGLSGRPKGVESAILTLISDYIKVARRRLSDA
jgi:O-antigen/teichoic acid export membrane protein